MSLAFWNANSQFTGSLSHTGFKSYLYAKCPNLGNPIHIFRLTDLNKYEAGVHRYWTHYSTECTERCTDTQHNDFEDEY